MRSALLLMATLLCCSCSQVSVETNSSTTSANVPSKVVQLSPDIPAANKNSYRSPGPAQKWGNPTLFIEQHGVIVILSPGRRSEDRAIPVGELRAALVALPVSAWPLGRVVRVQLNGLVPPDDANMVATSKEATEVLSELDIVADWMPSA